MSEAADAGDLVGRQVGPYRLESVIGAGPHGQVYLARHAALGVTRAVKVIRAAGVEQPQFRARFLQEAKTAANLFHPNIVPVHDFGVEGSVAYLVMEHVDSTSLSDRLAGLPVPQRVGDSALHGWIRDVAAALDHAHAFGVIHRDLTPANVLIRSADERALVTDFGIARALADSGIGDDALGTGAAYRSPEQCRGVQGLTTLSDVYSFAAILYEIATGSPPFGRGPAALAGHLEKAPPPTRLAGPHLPAGVDAVLARGLAKAPEDRQRTAGELATALLGALGEVADATRPPDPTTHAAVEPAFSPVWRPPVIEREPPPAPPPPPPAPARSPRIRRPALVALGALVVVVLAAGLGVLGVGAIGRLTARPPAATPPAAAPPIAAVAPASTDLPRPVQGSIGRPMTVSGARLTVVSVDTDARPPPPAGRLVAIEVAYEDVGDGTVSVSPFDWSVTDDSGAVYQALERGASGDLPQVQLTPRRTARGVIAFVVPRQAGGIVLHYSAERGDATATVGLGQ
jgi:serine/threonine protein kinase, bacterial